MTEDEKKAIADWIADKWGEALFEEFYNKCIAVLVKNLANDNPVLEARLEDAKAYLKGIGSVKSAISPLVVKALKDFEYKSVKEP